METAMRNTIARFVRHELGCQCPAAVFRRIVVEPCPREFGGWPQGRLISVGERLLILVLRSDDSDDLHGKLEDLLLEGRRLREARGFNRFRLVIATSCAGELEHSLGERFERLEGGDERMHLHVIMPAQLPALS